MKKPKKATGKKAEPAAEPSTKTVFYVSDVAEMLGLSKRTIRYYVKQGWLKPVQYNAVRLQFSQQSLDYMQKVMEKRMQKERDRRSDAMKEMRRGQMAAA